MKVLGHYWQRLVVSVLQNHRVRLKPWLLLATKQHKTRLSRRRVSFRYPIITSNVHFYKRQPTAVIDETACAHLGTSTNLNRRSTAEAIGLPNIRPLTTKVMAADGRIKGAQKKTIIPYNLPMEHRRREIIEDQNLHDNLSSIKQMVDTGLVKTIHPGNKGFIVRPLFSQFPLARQ